MSAGAYSKAGVYRKNELEVIGTKRNPYLVDYEQQRSPREYRHSEQGIPQSQRAQGKQPSSGRALRSSQRVREDIGEQRVPRTARQRGQGVPRGQEVRRAPRSSSQAETVRRKNIDLYPDNYALSRTQGKSAAMRKKRAAAYRKRIVRMQRMVLFAGICSILLLCSILCMQRIEAKTGEPGSREPQPKAEDDILPTVSASLIQGLPAVEFAKHPAWEENFLTPNEYSRPGDALEEVNNIFVHYTANRNTSAAQNRSYFEQLKDTHKTSASAHFIIGYNGEIIQCIPLDEIAYAVQTRNFDSVSIECCYKSEYGSFTQETYDSLIELLAWLTDIYDLKTDDILRHYDCGGKKCPIYYTEHEDAWDRLKRDVAEKL